MAGLNIDELGDIKHYMLWFNNFLTEFFRFPVFLWTLPDFFY